MYIEKGEKETLSTLAIIPRIHLFFDS